MSGTPPLEFTVAPEEDDLRLDQFVRRRLGGISRGSVLRLLERQMVLVDGRSQGKGFRLRTGQQVVMASAARDERPLPQPELDLDVLQVLPDLVVINKPAGMPCHPLVPGERDTVANALVARFPECALASSSPREGGVVHRLDWSTSGVLVAARNPDAFGRLRGQFSSRQVHKHYLALVAGEVIEPGRVRLALRTMPGDRTRMRVVSEEEQLKGQDAETEYWPVESLGVTTLIRLLCRTGRRHQIRVHLAAIGHPLVGDELYHGPELAGADGAFLHASRIQFVGVDLDFSAAMPRHRLDVLRSLGSCWPSPC